MLVVNRYDFDKVKEGEYWQTSLNLNDQYLMLQEQGVDGLGMVPPDGRHGPAECDLDSKRPRPRGDESPRGHADATLQRASRRSPPVPLCPGWCGWLGRDAPRPGAAYVYTVFEEIPADPAVSRKLAALLPRLDAELFADRDAASKELA